MKDCQGVFVVCLMMGEFMGSISFAAQLPIAPIIQPAPPTALKMPPKRLRSKPHAVLPEPSVESPTTPPPSKTGFNTRSAFTAAATPSPDSQTLSAPVTITYSGGSPSLLVVDSGTNKGVEAVITNSQNASSALYGLTNGSGSGLTGYNNGTAGPAGKFGITNANSAEPAITATTNGSGQALFGTITKARSNEPAIVGQNMVTENFGTGVEGDGNVYGIAGYSESTGVYGSADSVGVNGFSPGGTGVYGESSDGIGARGESYSGYGLAASSTSGSGLYAMSNSGNAIVAESDSGYAISAQSSFVGIYSRSTASYAIQGISENNAAVVGEDGGDGVGIYGSSNTGYAGYFAGPVVAYSYGTLSDRNVKTNIQVVDTKAILGTVSNLPLSSWVFKSDLKKTHIGPMAQDFHAAFGFDGDDDKHINVTDMTGVSLAAIQELNIEMRAKDSEIAELKSQLAIQAEAIATINRQNAQIQTALAEVRTNSQIAQR